MAQRRPGRINRPASTNTDRPTVLPVTYIQPSGYVGRHHTVRYAGSGDRAHRSEWSRPMFQPRMGWK